MRDACRAFPNQTEVTVEGLHFVQEDQPDRIGQAQRAWLLDLPV
jgi:haloalkane dehalogenase